MGICFSVDSPSVATAKLILEDGRLEEFTYPVRVSQILQGNPSCFICNADDMVFNDYVSAISDDQELRLGELYFVLPVTWLDSPLRAEEMAALAVKASLALKMDDDSDDDTRCWFGLRRVRMVEFSCEKRVEESTPMVAICGDGDGFSGGLVVNRRRRGSGDSSQQRKFPAKLSVILEE